MSSNAVRRTLLSTVIILTLACQSSSQTLLAVALSDLSRYLDAAARFISNAIVGLENVGVDGLSRDERTTAAKELRDISGSIVSLRVGQMTLIDDMTSYTGAVRKRGFASVSDVRSWSTILSTVRRVSGIVGDVLKLVNRSHWLSVAVAAEDRLALREVLEARVDLLARLEELPAPSTPDEIDRLEQMNGRYRELHKSLGALNVALTRAADKLVVK